MARKIEVPSSEGRGPSVAAIEAVSAGDDDDPFADLKDAAGRWIGEEGEPSGDSGEFELVASAEFADGEDADVIADAEEPTPGIVASHPFALGPDGACVVCGWGEGDHAGHRALTPGPSPDFAGDGSASRPAGDDVAGAGKKGQRDLPLGVVPELHHDRQVTERQARLAGKASVMMANALHAEWWAKQRLGSRGSIRLAYEVVGDGHQPIKDKDGDVVGLAEYRRLKATALQFEQPKDVGEGLPLFESDRVQLRPSLRAFAEAMERRLRELEEDNLPLAPTQGDIHDAFREFCQVLDGGDPSSVVAREAAALAVEAFLASEDYAEGGPEAVEPGAVCAGCGHLFADHMADGGRTCLFIRVVAMGDGSESEESCDCSGFRAVALTTGPAPDAAGEGGEGSVLDESLGIALEDASGLTADERGAILQDLPDAEVCGRMHNGHMAPCPWPAATCELPAAEVGG